MSTVVPVTTHKRAVMRNDLDRVRWRFTPRIAGTLLIEAARHGYMEIADWVFEHRAITKDHISRALQHACANGHLELAKWLYSKGANIWARNHYAIVYACKNGHLCVVQWLISQGARFDMDHYRVIKIAASKRHMPLLDWFMSAHPTECAACDWTIYMACMLDHLPMLKWLQDRGREIESYDFILACEYGSLEMVKWIYAELTAEAISCSMPAAITRAIGYNRVETLMWLHTIHPCANLAMKHGTHCLDVIKWAYSEGADVTDCAIQAICADYSVDAIDWLISIGLLESVICEILRKERVPEPIRLAVLDHMLSRRSKSARN